jgi:hypothetical protein
MKAKRETTWVLGGLGLFVVVTAAGFIPSLLDAFVPGILLSAWVGGSGLALAALTNRAPAPDPAWSASTTALALDAPKPLETWEEVEPEAPEYASLTPDETSFDEDNWTWAHNGEIVH